MKSIFPLLLVFLLIGFSGCTQVRTEFYRNETNHLYSQGSELYKQGDYEKARSAFEEVITLDPDYGPAHAALGNLAMIREEYGEAFRCYEQALIHDPELETALFPLLLTSNSYQEREPLLKAGVSLAEIYKLIMKGNIAETEDLLTENIPLDLLARDIVGITPGQLGELRLKLAEMTGNNELSSQLRLFMAFSLFYSQDYDERTIELLSILVNDTALEIRQEAYILLGRTYERTGKKNKAVDAYLSAVKEGKEMREVAHLIARLYKVDIAKVMDLPEKQETKPASAKATQFNLSTTRYIVPLSTSRPSTTIRKPNPISVSIKE